MPAGATSSMLELEKRPLLVLMDGHAMVYRAWHAIRQPLNVRRTGEDVRAVYGFLNTLLWAIREWKPTHCAIAFDLSKPTFRHLEYDEYKAHRPPMPPELRPQFDHVRRFMQVFGIPVFEHEGYEADDVLGTLCRQAEEQETEALILTGDTDELQLVSPWVRVLLSYSVQGRILYDVAKVRERYGGLGPDLVADIKALEGDTSDNIPGVPGVGSKTAIRLLNEFGSLESIYENLDSVTPPRAQQSLRDNKDIAHRSKFLATIVRDAPVQLDLKRTEFWSYDRATVVEALRELEFFSMVERIPDSRAPDETVLQSELPLAKERNTNYRVVDTTEALDATVAELDSSDGFSFGVETTADNPTAGDLVGLAFSNATDKGWYVPVGHEAGTQLPVDQVLGKLRSLLESEDTPKIAHDANFAMTVLSRYGVQVRGLAFDTLLGAHLSGRKATGLKALVLEDLNVEMTPRSELVGTGKKQVTLAQVPIEEAAPYAAANADLARQLYPTLREEVEDKGGMEILESMELPLVPVVVRMQINGVAIDTDLLAEISMELAEKNRRHETEMYDLVGHEFNLNSSQQLGDVLFNELRLPHTKRTQKGYSTDASSLEGLKQIIDGGGSKVEDVDPKALEVLDLVLEYRQVSKIRSTYVDTLPQLVNPKTGRVHAIYNQTGAATGRVSSNDPNVQNIPVRTVEGRRVRKAFVAQNAPDWILLAADYSQIELRILAHISGDPGLSEAFKEGQDIHNATASSVYGVPIGEVLPEMRRVAKIMNFGVIYGLSPFGISQQTGFSPDEGKQFIEAYFGQYPGIKEYTDSVKEQVSKVGYVETLNGRRRYIPEVMSSNFHIRAAGERMAINMPIQGTAADILKIAMVRIQDRMDALKLRAMMTIQVHDELIFELPGDELEEMQALVLEMMPSAMELTVPLEVELKSGHTWGDME